MLRLIEMQPDKSRKLFLQCGVFQCNRTLLDLQVEGSKIRKFCEIIFLHF